MIEAIGLGLSLFGGLAGNAEQKRQIEEQKKALALNASETRKGLALQASQTAQATQGQAIQVQAAAEQAEGMAKNMSAEGGITGNLETELSHSVANDAGQAFSGLRLNLNNQLAQNRMALNASQASYKSQINALRPDSLLAVLLNGAAPYLSGMFGDYLNSGSKAASNSNSNSTNGG